MKTSTRILLVLTAWAAGGCEWIAGIEDTTVRVDAGQAAPVDAPTPPDAGPLAPDAGLPSNCPAPCAGDAFADFDGTTTGANGRWGYVEVSTSFDSFVEMSSTTYPGGATGWIGTGTPPPGIAYCSMESAELPCGDQDKTLVFITTQADGNNHPGLSWTAPMAGDYQLRVNWAFPSTAPLVRSVLYIIHDRYGVQEEFAAEATPGTFGTMISLEAGDIITLTVFPDTSTSTSLAVNFFITGPLDAQGDRTTGERQGSAPAGFQEARRPRPRR